MNRKPCVEFAFALGPAEDLPWFTYAVGGAHISAKRDDLVINQTSHQPIDNLFVNCLIGAEVIFDGDTSEPRRVVYRAVVRLQPAVGTDGLVFCIAATLT